MDNPHAQYEPVKIHKKWIINYLLKIRKEVLITCFKAGMKTESLFPVFKLVFPY